MAEVCHEVTNPQDKEKRDHAVGSGYPVRSKRLKSILRATSNAAHVRAITRSSQWPLPASFPVAAGEPLKRLIDWARVALAPGESKQVSVHVPQDRLTVYDEASDSWTLVPGNYIIRVGGSSQDLPLQKLVNVTGHFTATPSKEPSQ